MVDKAWEKLIINIIHSVLISISIYIKYGQFYQVFVCAEYFLCILECFSWMLWLVFEAETMHRYFFYYFLIIKAMHY